MCGRVKCKVDPELLKSIFGVSKIKNEGKWKGTFNAGPLKFLPIAYMKRSQVEREDDEFLPKFDQEEEEEEEVKVEIQEEPN